MSRPRTAIPSYRLHKASGQAVVTIEGRDFYLGRHDTKASREKYERLVISWKAHGAPGLPPRQDAVALPLTVGSLVVRYLEHVDRDRLYHKHGKRTAEHSCLAVAFRPLVSLFASKSAATFGPLDLVTVRGALCKPLPPPKEGEPKRRRVHTLPIVRGSVNKHVDRIRRLFRWAVSMQLVPAATWQALLAVEGLRRGQSDAVRESPGVKPAAPRDVATVLRHVRPVIAAAIRLQWLSGMRPQEVLQLRMRDIDRAGAVWVFRPERHKTEHHGRVREIMLGPKAQRVLATIMRADPDAFLLPGRRDGRHLSGTTYRKAIRDACEQAGVESWSPNRLRHAAATRFRAGQDLDAARTALGHSSVSTTQIYAEADRRKAAALAELMG